MAEQDDRSDSKNRPTWPLMDAVVRANKSGGKQRETSEIPDLDLASNLMARQRKASATRRTGPEQKSNPAVEFAETCASHAASRRLSIPSIISEIVSKDINKLCRASTLQAGS